MIHDASTNTLIINPNGQPISSKTDEKQALRGFILTTVRNPEDLEKVMQGDHSGVQLSPVLASSTEQAIDFLQTKGHTILNIASIEFLEFQVQLIKNLAEDQSKEILRVEKYETKLGQQ